MDVAAWLSGLGLEQYTELFRENDIDGEILCGMTAEDLKELGISSFGHRRRLLNAITVLRREHPTRDVPQSAASAVSPPTSPPTIDAERRQLTVMFCELVGSTALSTRHEPDRQSANRLFNPQRFASPLNSSAILHGRLNSGAVDTTAWGSSPITPAKAIEIIGSDYRQDYILDPYRHAEEYKASAPLLAALLCCVRENCRP
jgi:hypothetical protein